MVWKIIDLGLSVVDTSNTPFTNESSATSTEKRTGEYTVYDGEPITILLGTTINFNQSNNTNSETPLDNFNDSPIFTGSSNNGEILLRFYHEYNTDANNELLPYLRNLTRSKGIKALYNTKLSIANTAVTDPLKYFGNLKDLSSIHADLDSDQPRLYVKCTDFRFDYESKSDNMVQCSLTMLLDEENDL